MLQQQHQVLSRGHLSVVLVAIGIAALILIYANKPSQKGDSEVQPKFEPHARNEAIFGPIDSSITALNESGASSKSRKASINLLAEQLVGTEKQAFEEALFQLERAEGVLRALHIIMGVSQGKLEEPYDSKGNLPENVTEHDIEIYHELKILGERRRKELDVALENYREAKKRAVEELNQGRLPTQN